MTTAEHPHPEAACDDCWGANVTWSAPNDIWNRVCRDADKPDPMLCPTCFIQRAAAAGIDVVWSVAPANRWITDRPPTKLEILDGVKCWVTYEYTNETVGGVYTVVGARARKEWHKLPCPIVAWQPMSRPEPYRTSSEATEQC